MSSNGDALAAPAPAGDAADREIASLPTHINVRSVSLAVLALLASVYALHWARAVFIPLLLGVMLSYALSPVVDRLPRWRLPRVLGAALVLIAVVSGFGSMIYSLSDDAAPWSNHCQGGAEAGPGAAPHAWCAVSTIDKVQQAATQLEQAAEATGRAPPATGVTRVQIEQPRLNIKEYLWSGTLGLAA